MTLETAAAPGESLLGRAKTSLRFRLVGRDRQTRVVAVEPAKCLIGAAASCTLRLDDNRPDDCRLDPFHCWIVRGAAHTVVRRISPAMRLNGRDFSDAVLNPGDRLAIGSYEIEVLPPESPATGEVEAVQAEVDRLSRMLVAQRAVWQAQNDELIAEIARTKAEAARQAADLEDDAARHVRTEQAIKRQQATWEQAVARFEEERRAWHAERLLKSAELNRASNRLAHVQAELARARDRAARLADETNAAAVQLGEARDAAKRLQKDLVHAQAQLDEERRGRHAELSQKAVELTEALERTIRLEADLATANESVTQLTEDVETQTRLYQRTQEALQKSEDEQTRLTQDWDSRSALY
ncbi:MAG: hypothetical protein ACREHD_22995, partial [Pirellulales bacterium]